MVPSVLARATGRLELTSTEMGAGYGWRSSVGGTSGVRFWAC